MKMIAFGLLCLLAVAAEAEPLTVDSIVALHAAGLGDETIIAKINNSNTVFDLTANELIALKGKGISGGVLTAMLGGGARADARPRAMSADSPDPLIPHSSGVYLMSGSGTETRMVRIDATVSNQAKTGGIIGYALTGGIASLSVKAVIQNETARVRTTSTKPVFYFFFDESNASSGQGTGTWLSGTAATVSAPSEFSLIGLLRKTGRREARVGSANIGGVKSGVLDKDRLSFEYENVRPGVFKVYPTNALPSGEYGFIYAVNGAATAGAVSARIFDFGVL